MKSVVSEKGQVTIPKALRDSLAIGPGTELDFSEEEGRLVARRILATDPFQGLVGLLPAMAVDDAVAEMRGPAWSPDLDEPTRAHGNR